MTVSAAWRKRPPALVGTNSKQLVPGVRIELGTAVRTSSRIRRSTPVAWYDSSARVRIDSGANGLVIDTLKLGTVGGETRWETPEFAAARDRYDITIRGGSHDLAIVAG